MPCRKIFSLFVFRQLFRHFYSLPWASIAERVDLISWRNVFLNLCLLQIKEGLEWSQKALDAELANPQGLEGRCHLYIGLGYSLQASATHLRKEKDALNASALSAFYK